jgi:excisionase family DNA binding protein
MTANTMTKPAKPRPRRKRQRVDDPPGQRVSDEALHELMEHHDWRMISPGGVANLLGVSRQRVHNMITDGTIRAYRSEDERRKFGPITVNSGPRWVYIPLSDVEAYANRVGRPLRRTR